MKKIFGIITALICAIGCMTGCFGGQDKPEKVTVYMPDGAPALALAELMHLDTVDDEVEYYVTKADAIASKVSFEDETKNADLCVMPLNLAAKNAKVQANYVMLGSVTNGNLYMISKTETQYTADNLDTLIGKTVGVLQINNVPGLTFKAVLKAKGIDYTELKNNDTAAEDKVNLVALADASAVVSTQADCFVIAEPAVTAQVAKNGFHIVGNLQTLYGGENGYPQAVLVVKKDFFASNGDWVKTFTNKVADAAVWLETATGEEIVAAINGHLDETLGETSLKAPLLKSATLARCGVKFIPSADCKGAAVKLLNEYMSINSNAAAIPQEEFFAN